MREYIDEEWLDYYSDGYNKDYYNFFYKELNCYDVAMAPTGWSVWITTRDYDIKTIEKHTIPVGIITYKDELITLLKIAGVDTNKFEHGNRNSRILKKSLQERLKRKD